MQRRFISGADIVGVVEPGRRRSALILLILMLVASIALLSSAVGFRQRLQDVRSAHSDNRGWVVSQLQVDYQNLVIGLDRIGHMSWDTADPDHVLSETKREFDVFYSRIGIFTSTLSQLDVPPDLADQLVQLRALRVDLAKQIDAITNMDFLALKRFSGTVRAAQPLVRNVTVNALEALTFETAYARRREERLFNSFFFQSVTLFGLMALGAILVMRLWRELERRSGEAARFAAILTRAFDSSLNAVIVADETTRLLFTNARAQQVFGRSADALLRAKIKEIVPPDKQAEAYLNESVYRGGGEGFHPLIGKGAVIGVCLRADGREFPAEILMFEDRDLNGERIIISFIRDISKQVSAESKLLEALKKAEQAAQAKSMFLSTMSHEMRTPLHGLMASLDLIEESRLSALNRKLLKTAHDCSARALMQVNDVLELARLGESSETREEFQPASIAADIVGELRPLANRADNRIELTTDGPFDRYVFEGLPIAFSRALYNLAGNAVKFTENGRIDIRLILKGEPEGEMLLRVEVEDTGVGIAPENQGRIFENFETANRSEISSTTGTGLGLPIAKLAVERQGGKLALSSAPGVGTRFCFTIPIKVARPMERPDGRAHSRHPAAEAQVPVAAEAKGVLIVDDNDVNLTLMAEMVRRMGHRHDTAVNGQEAVEKAAKSAFDVILMDFSMPVMDGPSAATAIRHSQGASAQAVIIGVTALIEAESGQGGAAVMDEILVKPVSYQTLDEMIRDTRHDPERTMPPEVQEPDEIDPAQALEELCQMVGKDVALQLVQEALADAARAIEAMVAPDLPLTEKGLIVHKAIGPTALLGFSELSETLIEAERATAAGRDPAETDLPNMVHGLLEEARATYLPSLNASCAGQAEEA